MLPNLDKWDRGGHTILWLVAFVDESWELLLFKWLELG